MKINRLAGIALAVSLAGPCVAHVGSPDVYFQGDAGPYHLVVAIRTPQMIPGVAEIQIRSDTPGVRQVKIVPLYIVGEGSKYPPPPDVLVPSKDDPQFFTGNLWLMASGSWQVRIEAVGDAGSGTIAVPVPAAARNTMPMKAGLGVLLSGLMLLLVLAMVSIVGAARREGQLEPGVEPGGPQKRSARVVMAIAFLVVVGTLVMGGVWWKASAAKLSDRMIYKAPELFVSLVPGEKMILRVGDSKWHTRRPDTVATNLIPDHGHLMHLFLIRVPQMDRFYHLHPVEDKGGVFVDELPPIAAGHYQIFADIVRVSGFPDTLSAEMDIPETTGKPLAGDDSTVSAAAISHEVKSNLISALTDGSRMVWEREQGPLPAGLLLWFRFRVEDANGEPLDHLDPYMGMAGHAEFVRSDLSVFAHVHPDGSVPMAAVQLADATLGEKSQSSSGANSSANQQGRMAGMAMGPIGPEVAFPYGFPKAGEYRIFVQVKHGGQVETGVFDAEVR